MPTKQFNIACILWIVLSSIDFSHDRAIASTIPIIVTPEMVKSIESSYTALTTQKTKQTASYQTVADYFFAIPDRYLRVTEGQEGISIEERQELLNKAKQGISGNIYDPKNGYLQLTRNSDLCSIYTIAIFSRPAASPLVAVNISCTLGDSLKILDPDLDWQDVTKTVLSIDLSPKITEESKDNYLVEINLPRIGRAIEIYHLDESNNRMLFGRYSFNGDRFVSEKEL